jgi:hypothetical protein
MSGAVVDARTIVVKPVQLTWMVNPTIQGGQMAIFDRRSSKS